MIELGQREWKSDRNGGELEPVKPYGSPFRPYVSKEPIFADGVWNFLGLVITLLVMLYLPDLWRLIG